MAEQSRRERKEAEEQQKLEAMTSEERQEQIREDQKKAARSVFLSMTALIAIVVLCIAWFVSNRSTRGTSAQVAADSKVRFQLASVGARQDTEQKYLKDESNNHILNAGTEKSHETYMDLDLSDGTTAVKATEVTKTQDYHVGSANLAWYLNGQEGVSPGASGKLEFYLIPQQNDSSVTVTLDAKAYVNENEDKTGRAVESENTGLQNLISGHILFFRGLNDTKGYSGWIRPDNGALSFTVTPEGGFTAGTPYKITLYWVWPRYFRNYIYNYRSTNGDLFTDISTNNQDYQALLSFVQTQGTKTAVNNETLKSESNMLFYIENAGTDQKVTDQIIISTMKDEVLDSCTDAYDQADEYIGQNADYFYINVTVH